MRCVPGLIPIPQMETSTASFATYAKTGSNLCLRMTRLWSLNYCPTALSDARNGEGRNGHAAFGVTMGTSDHPASRQYADHHVGG